MNVSEHMIVAAIADLLSTVRCATVYAHVAGHPSACGTCNECRAEHLARALADGAVTDEDHEAARSIIYGGPTAA